MKGNSDLKCKGGFRERGVGEEVEALIIGIYIFVAMLFQRLIC
jgi:hypothetical protein